MDRTEDRGLDRFDRVVLVVGWRSGAGEIVDAIDLEFERLRDIVADELEIRVYHQMRDVAFSPGEIVIQANDFVSLVEQAFAEMGAEEAGTAGDQNSHGGFLTTRPESSNPNCRVLSGTDLARFATVAQC